MILVELDRVWEEHRRLRRAALLGIALGLMLWALILLPILAAVGVL